MFKQLNQFLGPAPNYGKHYLAWKRRDDVTPELAAQIESMGREYVHHFLTDVKYRLRPYWKLILAAETINPCGPARLSRSAWEGVADLCARAHMSVARTQQIIGDLKMQRAEAEDWCRAEVRECKTNLLKFYRDRLHSEMRQGLQPRHPFANQFATIIFCLHFVSSSIETYFSKTRYDFVHLSTVHNTSIPTVVPLFPTGTSRTRIQTQGRAVFRNITSATAANTCRCRESGVR